MISATLDITSTLSEERYKTFNKAVKLISCHFILHTTHHFLKIDHIVDECLVPLMCECHICKEINLI